MWTGSNGWGRSRGFGPNGFRWRADWGSPSFWASTPPISAVKAAPLFSPRLPLTVRIPEVLPGDTGCLDADGFLTLKDRSKDLVISGGSNIYPREVEEVLLAHPAVSEVAVIGQPDAEWGEVPVAFVVARAGAAPDSAALDTWCLAQMARFKRPRHYHWVAALPKNSYGKVLKTALRAGLAIAQDS